MTADDHAKEEQYTIPMEGDDITQKKDGGVLKVTASAHELCATSSACAYCMFTDSAKLVLAQANLFLLTLYLCQICLYAVIKYSI